LRRRGCRLFRRSERRTTRPRKRSARPRKLPPPRLKLKPRRPLRLLRPSLKKRLKLRQRPSQRVRQRLREKHKTVLRARRFPSEPGINPKRRLNQEPPSLATGDQSHEHPVDLLTVATVVTELTVVAAAALPEDLATRTNGQQAAAPVAEGDAPAPAPSADEDGWTTVAVGKKGRTGRV
jgi:hypothetical protein